MAAAGKVCTGFSLPYVALYNNGAYTSGMKLARGVDVNVAPEASDDNKFYADNHEAENASGTMNGGTVDLTVDGLLTAAEKLIMGLPAAVSDWTAYDDDQQIPYVGIGYIARYMSDGVTTYVPTVIVKAKFAQIESSAATQEEDIDWQTQSLSATMYRGDDAKHTWKYVGEDQETEEAAEALLKAKLGITTGG
jgi:phi13 family phage major tail protein